jgi:hypothetical protein
MENWHVFYSKTFSSKRHRMHTYEVYFSIRIPLTFFIYLGPPRYLFFKTTALDPDNTLSGH